jgi:hypothetical protein
MPGTADWAPKPVMVDGSRYPSALDAARAIAPDPSKRVRVYAAMRRVLARGERSFMGHTVFYEPPPRRYDIEAAGSGSDFGKLAECPVPGHPVERKPASGPLLRYPPFEGPLYRGINHYH